jgi:Ca2+-binding EF-hand superfamily protein
MNIRRERTHQSGLTNLDFKAKGDAEKTNHFTPNLKLANFGTMSKTNYRRAPSATTFKEQVAASGGWLNTKYKNEFYKDQRYETAAQKYKEAGRKPKIPVLIANKKTFELEDQVWNEKPFNGDTNKNAAEMTYHARQRDLIKNDQQMGRKKTVDPNV